MSRQSGVSSKLTFKGFGGFSVSENDGERQLCGALDELNSTSLGLRSYHPTNRNHGLCMSPKNCLQMGNVVEGGSGDRDSS